MGEKQAVETPECRVPRCLGQAKVEDLRADPEPSPGVQVWSGDQDSESSSRSLCSVLCNFHISAYKKVWMVRWYLPALRENQSSERIGDVVQGHRAGKHQSQD